MVTTNIGMLRSLSAACRSFVSNPSGPPLLRWRARCRRRRSRSDLRGRLRPARLSSPRPHPSPSRPPSPRAPSVGVAVSIRDPAVENGAASSSSGATLHPERDRPQPDRAYGRGHPRTVRQAHRRGRRQPAGAGRRRRGGVPGLGLRERGPPGGARDAREALVRPTPAKRTKRSAQLRAPNRGALRAGSRRPCARPFSADAGMRDACSGQTDGFGIVYKPQRPRLRPTPPPPILRSRAATTLGWRASVEVQGEGGDGP